eukprot:GFUD01032032.1.p1 GENE.GFUD01032032.1~~GFUD01032032.1.p1  ORF type:complete len:499 (+),score=143.08 GFUD01032032.1:143-1639(+)
MAFNKEKEALRNMILTFRVSELQMLLGFAGRNQSGKKTELQDRSLELLQLNSTPVQKRIRELFQSSQETQQAAMIPGANALQYSAAYAQMLGLAGFTTQQQGIPQAGRANPYAAQQAQAQVAAYTAAYGTQPLQAKPNQTVSQPCNVKFKQLPFYDIHGELLKPTSLVTQGSSRFQEAQFQFLLSPEQATNIASNRDIRMGSKLDYLYQIQLRFCLLDPSAEQGDEFPPSICVQVNGKMCPLPNPIPTNKPNVEPKRPPRPIHITPLCKLTPILNNTVSVKWAADYGKGWVVGIWLVEKLSSDQLLERLTSKGKRNSDFTRELIKTKLTDDEDGIATTNLKVTVSCPLGKMRMSMPCRPTTCDHLQCFDASLFLMMNEKKPTWTCPVCDSAAKYDDLMVDGYFEEVIKAPELPDEENEIILNQDGSWNPVPKDEEEERKRKEKEEEERKNAVVLDLSDDDEDYTPAPKPAADPDAAPAEDLPVLPPPPPAEIECIDIE